MKKYYTASFHNGGRKEDTKDTKGTVKSVKFQANREHNIRDEEYCASQSHIGFKNKTEQEHREWEKTHVFIDEKPEDAYERIFGEAIKKYDEKQKRSDRKIKSGKNYYEKIKNSKNKVPVYEFIITLGNKDNLPDNPEDVKNIYIEALEKFRERNPNLEVIGAYYHDDESRDDGRGGKIPGAPHLHVDYIPVSRNRWQNFIDEKNKKDSLIDKIAGKENKKKTRVNGLDVENSLTEALESQGFKSVELDPVAIEKKFGIHINEKKYKNPERQAQYEEFLNSRVDEKGKKVKTRLLTAQMQWIKKERDCLIRLFEEHGYKIKNPGEHRQHFETEDYIEYKDKNIQEMNIELYNELSNKLEFLKEEEQELLAQKKLLDEKEKILKQKEIDQEQKQKEQTEKDAYLESKTKIVETAETQLEEARQINAETEQYRNDIEQIKKDVKTEIEKDYTEKYQQLYEVQEYQKQQTIELEKQKEQQGITEQKQKQKALELIKRESNILDLEVQKKAVEDKEKDIIEREEKIKIDTETNKEKEKNIAIEKINIELEKKEIQDKQELLKKQEENINIWQKNADKNSLEVLKECEKSEKDRWYRPLDFEAFYKKVKACLTGAWAKISNLMKKNETLEKELNTTKKRLETWRKSTPEELEEVAKTLRDNTAENWENYETKMKTNKRSRSYSGISYNN